MTLKIALSRINELPFDFAVEVATFQQALLDHRSTVGEAAPSAPHPWVEAAVRRVRGNVDGQPDDFVIDYESFDDTPPPAPEPAPPTLDERKHALAQQVAVGAVEATNALIPPLKRAFWDFEFSRIVSEISAAAKPDDEEVHDDFLARRAAVHRKAHPADADFYDAHMLRLKKLARINYQVAQQHSDIHDLTVETIGAWKPVASELLGQ